MLTIINELIKKYNINAEQLYILALLNVNKNDLIAYGPNINCRYELMQNLHRRLFVRFMSADMDNYERLEYIEFAEKGLVLQTDSDFQQYCSIVTNNDGDIDELTDKFRDLFPDGVSNQYAKRFKGTLSKVKSNLSKFKKEFNYSDEVILLATEKMISTMESKGKKDWIAQAHYFIYHKDRGSELAEECEAVLKGDIASSDSFIQQI